MSLDRRLFLVRSADDPAHRRRSAASSTPTLSRRVHAQVTAVLTNTMTTAPYRGGGRPEPIYVTETHHRQGGASARHRPGRAAPAQHHPRQRDALSRRRCARSTTAAISARTSTTAWRWRLCRTRGARRAAARRRGKLLGIGVATAVAATGGRDSSTPRSASIPAGGVVLLTGSMDHGQGHGTTFKQVLSEKLGIDADLIRYRYGDTDLVTMGIGTFGSRSALLAGSAIIVAADKLIDKGSSIAAHMMEAAVGRRRFRARPLHHRRHRPLGRASPRSRDIRFIARNSAERHRDRVHRARQFRAGRTRRPSPRGAHLRGRDRRRDRPGRAHALFRGRRCRHRAQPAARARARSMAASSRASARR